MKTVTIKSTKRVEAINITKIVREYISFLDLDEGLCVVYTPHTTAAIIINEGADPDVMKDLLKTLSDTFPYTNNYKHIEGNSDAHIKSSLIGNSRIIPFSKKQLMLGTWEAVYFLEFDGPRTRKIHIMAK